jgi:hypothetical protein
MKTDNKERVCGCGMASRGSGYGPVAGCCEHGNAPEDSVKLLAFSWTAERLSAFEGPWSIESVSIFSYMNRSD